MPVADVSPPSLGRKPGSPAGTLAATNKCLARSNKSRTGVPATERRNATSEFSHFLGQPSGTFVMSGKQSEMVAESAILQPEPLLEPKPLLGPKPANIQRELSYGKTVVGAFVLFALSGIAVGLLPMSGFWQSRGSAPPPPGIEQNAQRAVGPSLFRPVLATELQQAIGGDRKSVV